MLGTLFFLFAALARGGKTGLYGFIGLSFGARDKKRRKK